MPSNCIIPGCDSVSMSRGWCGMHYARWRRKGDPLVVVERWTLSPAERLLAKVEKTDGCWLWRGAKYVSGYGIIWHSELRTPTGAHRYAYELWVGPIPAGLEVDHICRQRLCVNPEHLRLLTPSENASRWAREKTHCPAGHPLSSDNTYLTPTRSGYAGRKCATCVRERQRVRREQAHKD